MTVEKPSSLLPLPHQSLIVVSIAPLSNFSIILLRTSSINATVTDVQVPTFKISNAVNLLQAYMHEVYLRPTQVAPSLSNTINCPKIKYVQRH